MIETRSYDILIAGQANEIGRSILPALASRGVRGIIASDAREARQRLATQRFHMAFVQVDVADDRAWGLISHLCSERPDMPLVALGPAGDVPCAVASTRAGASEYLTRPVESARLGELLDQLLPGGEAAIAQANEDTCQSPHRIAGQSQALMETIDLARRVAQTSMPILISGPSGTGKELISHLVHRSSRRANGPYVSVNCAALSESLLESELFGHERGAFTGAHAQRKGRFELAHRGTLLLDEISETGPRLQAELLRVLEQQDFQRLGGSESVNVDVRIICTSNRDLASEVSKGNFRQDLYYRIRGVQLSVPSLRDRTEDIPELIWHFVNLYAHETRRSVSRLDDAMLAMFGQYDWPGNVRQLRNIIRTALVLGSGPVLSLSDAPHLVGELREQETQGELVAETAAESVLTLQDLERQAVLQALKRTNSHQVKAAKLLGISDRTLRDKIRRYRQDGHFQLEGESTWSVSRAS